MSSTQGDDPGMCVFITLNDVLDIEITGIIKGKRSVHCGE